MYKEIQKRSGAKSCIRKGFLKYEKSAKIFSHDEASISKTCVWQCWLVWEEPGELQSVRSVVGPAG